MHGPVRVRGGCGRKVDGMAVLPSAPEMTDVEAKALLLKSWTDNPTRELAEIDIVDIRDPSEVKESWSDFIVRTHGGVSKVRHGAASIHAEPDDLETVG